MRVILTAIAAVTLASCSPSWELEFRSNATLTFESVESPERRPLITVYDDVTRTRHRDVALGIKRCEKGVRSLRPGDQVTAIVEKWVNRKTGEVDTEIDLTPLREEICR